jgi:hypothetical protein
MLSMSKNSILTFLELTFPGVEKQSAGSLIVWRNINTDIMEETWCKWTELWKWRKVIFPF